MDQGVDELRSSSVKGKNPFQDVRVREALNLLGNTDDQDAVFAFDLERAKSLMADAGYADGFDVQLDCPNNRYNNDEKICQAAVAMLAKIGVDIKLDAIPKAQHFPKIQNRVSDFYMLGWGVPTLDSHYVFSYAGYKNATVDEITAAIATETDIDKRTGMIDEAWSQVKQDIPYIPLHHQVIAWGINDRFDVPQGSDDGLRPRYIVAK